MLDHVVPVYRFVLGYTQALMADIDDSAMTEQPIAGWNHPAWILGHLTVGADFAGRFLGLEPAFPESWHAQFGPGSTPLPDRSAYPSKADLLAKLAECHERVIAALPDVTAEHLAQPKAPPLEILRHLPTVGDLLMHLLTTHPATHLGQLTAWRRAMGMPLVFKV